MVMERRPKLSWSSLWSGVSWSWISHWKTCQYGVQWFKWKWEQYLGDGSLSRECHLASPDPSCPLVVFLHGLKGCPLLWYSWIAELPAEWSWFVPRMREWGNWNSDELLRDLEHEITEKLQSLVVPRPLVIVGSSNGARLGMNLVERFSRVPDLHHQWISRILMISVAGVLQGTEVVDEENWTGRWMRAEWIPKPFKVQESVLRDLSRKHWLQKQNHPQPNVKRPHHPDDSSLTTRVPCQALLIGSVEDWLVRPLDSALNLPDDLWNVWCPVTRHIYRGESHQSITLGCRDPALGWLFENLFPSSPSS